MTRRIFADTYYYFAAVNPTDAGHAAALQIGEAAGIRIVTTEWILLEIADGLAAKPQRATAVELIHAIRSDKQTRVVPFRRKDYDAAFRLFASRTDKGWSLTDCTSFVVMERLGIADALTADRHFAQAGFRPLLAP